MFNALFAIVQGPENAYSELIISFALFRPVITPYFCKRFYIQLPSSLLAVSIYQSNNKFSTFHEEAMDLSIVIVWVTTPSSISERKFHGRSRLLTPVIVLLHDLVSILARLILLRRNWRELR